MNNEASISSTETGERLFEKHLQYYIASNIQDILRNSSLVLIGTEVQTTAGRIDILAVERGKCAWIIETKIGTAARDAVAQLQSYMAAISDIEEYEDYEVVGILIAENFDEKCKYALRMIKDISSVRYSLTFSFSNSEDTNPRSPDEDPWVVDIERKVFHPKNNTRNVFSISDRYLVNDLLSNNDIELQTDNFSVGKYRKID